MVTICPKHIQVVRTVLLWLIRMVAVILILYGGYLIFARLFYAFFIGDGITAGPGAIVATGIQGLKANIGIGSDHGLVRGVPMLIIGIVLAFLSRRLARWVVAMPELGCPRCGYAGSGRPGKCPECGLDGVGPDATGDDLKP